MKATKEQRLIEAIKSWTAESSAESLIGDDCAVLPGNTLVTSDMLVEGRHFDLGNTAPSDVGWKAVAVNLSDIAAMGGRPNFLIINVAMPAYFTESQFEQLYTAMVECANTYDCRIVGGDLTACDQLVISVTVLGQPSPHGCLLRSGALPGDIVITTGDFGASAAGLWLLQNGRQKRYVHCLQAHLRPQPALKAATTLVEIVGSRGALMDTSDGLGDALVQIAQASKVAISVDASSIPVHEETRAINTLTSGDALAMALYGGEDYQLLACVSAQHWAALEAAPGNPFKKIGVVEAGNAGNAVTVVEAGGNQQIVDMQRTYQHW